MVRHTRIADFEGVFNNASPPAVDEGEGSGEGHANLENPMLSSPNIAVLQENADMVQPAMSVANMAYPQSSSMPFGTGSTNGAGAETGDTGDTAPEWTTVFSRFGIDYDGNTGGTTDADHHGGTEYGGTATEAYGGMGGQTGDDDFF